MTIEELLDKLGSHFISLTHNSLIYTAKGESQVTQEGFARAGVEVEAEGGTAKEALDALYVKIFPLKEPAKEPTPEPIAEAPKEELSPSERLLKTTGFTFEQIKAMNSRDFAKNITRLYVEQKISKQQYDWLVEKCGLETQQEKDLREVFGV